jgi:hypothetical protein
MRFSIILLVSLLGAGPASAGVVIIMEQTGGLEGGGTRQQPVFVEPDRLKLPQGNGGVIYRADQDKAYNYDDERKTYTEMSRESLGQMRQQMDAALAQVRQQMANMPPDQRKMVEEMLAKQGGALGQPGVAPTVTFERSGGKQTVGKWSCEGYARLENGRKTQDMCIARIADVGLTRDDLKAFTSMSAMLKTGLGRDQGTAMDFDAMSKAIGFEGVPVRTVVYLPNGRQHESTMKSVERKSLPPATFELPAGYTRQEIPRPPGR